MRRAKSPTKTRFGIRKIIELPLPPVNTSISNPEIFYKQKERQSVRKPKKVVEDIKSRGKPKSYVRLPPEGVAISESCLSTPRNDQPECDTVRRKPEFLAKGDEHLERTPITVRIQSRNNENNDKRFTGEKPAGRDRSHSPERKVSDTGKLSLDYDSPLDSNTDSSLLRQIRDIHVDSRKSSKLIKQSRDRLIEIQKKSTLTESDIKEIAERNEMLLREMERFDRLTISVQKLVGVEIASRFSKSKDDTVNATIYYPWKSNTEPVILNEMENNETAVFLNHEFNPDDFKTRNSNVNDQSVRSKSEIDLTRRLSESYDMQEKLVADNADLEVKRYVLYKELMTKDQSLETCRAQIKRLQSELKMISKENALLREELERNNLKETDDIEFDAGDATTMKRHLSCKTDSADSDLREKNLDVNRAQDLVAKLENYKSSTIDLEKHLGQLELEVRHIQVEMDTVKKAGEQISACRGGGGKNTCFKQNDGPPVPPMTKACGVCPPCPAPCNPNAPPTPAEKEVQKLTIQLRQTEENFKTKVTECAMLRADLLKRKEELEKERCQHREAQNKLRELEMKFEGLATHTNMMMGTKEQAFEQEVNVRALKKCYREAREEIDELRLLLKEQNDQLQDYRVKYLQAQQLVEEQRRQMDMMDMDNTRISEQINLEIQKVKLKFQEKLQELAPIPDLLKATQMRLKDAQQSQAIAEHNAEQLARELNCAREKVHVLLHNSIKPPEKPAEKGNEEKQLAMLQQRISQLTENNIALKGEVERLKSNVIRMEEAVLANEKRLQEKLHECAALGGELDRARDEAARALQRANERTETMKKCMQTTVAELERQLAASRAQVHGAEKEREELQCRMQCQIKRLNDNFEQAQLRILGLQTQVQTLKRTASSEFGDGEGGDQQECACKTFFDNP